MALLSNKPDVDRLRRQLRFLDVEAGKIISADVTVLLQELLDASIADIELKASRPFDGRAFTELRDGNGTDAITPFYYPITSVSLVKVELPVLALSRTYTTEEVKVYRRGRRIRIFTFKLAAEHATLHLDRQVYANIFPSLPQCVTINYTAGFPRVDDLKAPTLTSLDGGSVVNGVTVLAGDQRHPKELNWLTLQQQAVVCDAAATYLAQVARNQVGIAGSVSFDGYSKGLNPQAFGPAVEALIQRRDELLASTKTLMMLTVG